jgi:hypothetical protein
MPHAPVPLHHGAGASCAVVGLGQSMIEPTADGRMMISGEPYRVVINESAGIVHSVTLPVRWSFNGATIPRVAWWLIGTPFQPRFVVAAAVHDWYCEQSVARKDYQLRVIGDAVFFLLLERAGVPRWKRTAMYLAVRAYSRWVFWRLGKRRNS